MLRSTKRAWNLRAPVASITFRGNLQHVKRMVDLKHISDKAVSLLVVRMMIHNALSRLR